MAVTDSTFAIYCQTRACKINDKALRVSGLTKHVFDIIYLYSQGCGVVMLFDMKLEAYLAGSASMEHVPDPVKQDETINEGDSS